MDSFLVFFKMSTHSALTSLISYCSRESSKYCIVNTQLTKTFPSGNFPLLCREYEIHNYGNNTQ